MSDFTTQLRHLLDAGYVPTLSTYPIFDEAYRPVLNAKILKHYQFREIGLETADLFDYYLESRMNEIMPVFNILYTAQNQLINTLRNVDITETNSKQTAGTNVSSTAASEDKTVTLKKGKTTNKVANSDTPQGNLTIIDLEAGGYASNVQIGETDQDDDTNISAGINSLSTAGEGATTEEYTKTITGNQGKSKPELYKQLQGALINIDQKIITALSDLFMGVFN